MKNKEYMQHEIFQYEKNNALYSENFGSLERRVIL